MTRFKSLKRLLKDFRIIICGLFILLLALTAIFAPLMAPHSFSQMNSLERFSGPSPEFLLGTDEFGRDILSRLIQGARLTLIISLGAVAISSIIGTLGGLVAGYSGGWTENILMRLMDALFSFPPFLLAIFVIVFLGPSVINLILTIGLLYIPRFARIAHSSTLLVKELEYVEAAQALGASIPRIIGRHILPNIFAPIMVQMSLTLGAAVLLESGLSFLGLGPPPPTPSWGRMVQQSARFMQMSPYGIIWPSVVISLTVLSFNIFADAVRDNLDPRLRQ